jgi:type II secretory ATPase GspE/PulE/Tfp pilus assembly ATPase PilB-like protein
MISDAMNGRKPLARSLLEQVDVLVLLPVIAGELGLPWVDLYGADLAYRVDEDLIRRCDVKLLRKHSALPLRAADNSVAVAMANPRGDQDMVDYLKQRLPGPVTFVLASGAQVQQRLVAVDTTSYATVDTTPAATAGASSVAASSSLPTTVEENPVVEWVDNLLSRAAMEGASDLHFKFESDESLLVRFRIDGVLVRQEVPLRGRENEIVNALLAKCPTIDPFDKTRPQDGTFSFVTTGGRKIDSRLAMLPQVHGPTVVCRLLDPANINRRLDDMGFAPEILVQMRRAMQQHQGAVFVIGPTGSGKTTTLYGLLRELPAEQRHILTAEDPVEYRLPFIGQTQIRNDLGEKSLTFAKALRAFLRLDPDVILVGEVRDGETAEVAMHAALTGHLVLSTLHAKSALGTFARLEELGVDPYLTAETLTLAINQRLIRRVHDCGTVRAPNARELAFIRRRGLAIPEQVREPAPNGCPACNGTGYRGRIAVVEVLEPNDKVRTLIAEKAPQSEIAAAAAAGQGYTSILSDAYRHVLKGTTTMTEMLRVLDTGGQ